MNIYEKIFARLEELHMSQIELSRRTGIATSTISDWRKKKINPQADKLVVICKALDMSLVDLLCDEEDKKNTTVTMLFAGKRKGLLSSEVYNLLGRGILLSVVTFGMVPEGKSSVSIHPV